MTLHDPYHLVFMPCVLCSDVVSELVFTITGTWQKWWYVISEIRLWKIWWLLSWLLFSLSDYFFWGKPAAMLLAAWWRSICGEGLKPLASSPVNKPECESVSPFQIFRWYCPAVCLIAISWEILIQNHQAKLLPDSWPSENYCFRPLNFG